MSNESKLFAGVLLILILTIELGGNFLLNILRGRLKGFENSVQVALFRAGHAHAGVLVILALVSFLYVDQTALGGRMKTVTRVLMTAAPLLISGGFFGGGGPMKAGTPPGSLIRLVYVGAAALAGGLVLLGV